MTNTGHRQRWLPVLAASRLAEPGTRPARLMLLGEELAAFRDGEGNLGIIDGLCPHNGSLLAWGVAEDDGLTCAYHGWAFNVKGECLWAPGSPNTPSHLAQYNVKAYPLVEADGLLWTYVGQGEPPEQPQPAWCGLPPDHLAATQWQEALPTPDGAALAQQSVGWPVARAEGDSVVLTGPNGLQLYLTAVPGFQQTAQCLALLWHPGRSLTEAERYAMTGRASGPAAGLQALTAA